MPPGVSKLARTATLAFGLLVVSAGCGYTVSDTGYLGTWERELAPGRVSRIALWEEGGQTWFCWSRRGNTRGETVRCAPGGISEVIIDRELVYEYRFSVRPAEGGDVHDRWGEIFVDVEGVPRVPGSSAIRWTDRLAVQPGGLELYSYKISLNGEAIEKVGSPLVFTKIADVPI